MAPVRNKRRVNPSKPARKGKRFPGSRAIEPQLQESEPQEKDRDESPFSVSSNSSSDAGDDPSEAIRPYSKLLRAFNVTLDRPEHTPKRRKPERTELNTEVDARNADLEDLAKSEAGDEVDVRDTDDQDMSGDEATAADPFENHFANPDPEYLKSRIDSVSKSAWIRSVAAFGTHGNAEFYKPENSEADESSRSIVPEQVMKKRLVPAYQQSAHSLSPISLPLLPHIFGYRDILFAARTPENALSLRSVVCLHALNHVYKTRDKVLKNNARTTANPDGIQYRDQGFTRPKVLLILPTRNSCARYIEKITEICLPEQQENKKRFEDDFVQRSNDRPEDRPDDFLELFEGNTDDMFRLGIKFTRKTIKFYSQFYNSDLIIASPLGLRMAIDGKEYVVIDRQKVELI
jgi:U3 small nucleolar RNA-associated protein 25